MQEFRISFNVSGCVTQTVRLTKPGMTASELKRLLEAGEVATSIQKGGNVEVVANGEVIGSVVQVTNECEYDEFEVETA